MPAQAEKQMNIATQGQVLVLVIKATAGFSQINKHRRGMERKEVPSGHCIYPAWEVYCTMDLYYHANMR